MSPVRTRSTRPRHPLGSIGSIGSIRKVLVVVAVAAVAAALPPITGGAPAFAATRHRTHGTTVTGTVSGDHAWDPAANKQYKAVPSVTVDQTDDLTDQVVHVTWKNFTPSQDGAGNFFAAGLTYYAVTVLECRGTNPRPPTLWKWPDFGPDCYNFTADNANASHGAGNQVYTLTGSNGQGESYFHVETGIENDFLRCDARHPCSLVVVPNWGGTQPQGSAPASPGVNCSNHSGDVGLIFGNYALDSELGGACSWQDRIVVPLHFAQTPQSCPARNFTFAAEGAPALGRTIDQWRAGWCTGKSALSFDFDSGTSEDLARQAFLSGSSALTSAVDLAVVNQPASPAEARNRKFVYAPLANSAVTIAYHIDNSTTGKLITRLTLDARLVAKLVTQSYSLAFGCTIGSRTTRNKQGPNCDPAVKGNPIDIFADPEFRKLNPEYKPADFPGVNQLDRGQFLPLVINGTSDMVQQLTSWLWSNPAARSFLQGKPDPWGMHVNSYYKNEPMPTNEFQVLDPGYTAPPSKNPNGGVVPGQSTMQVTWNPISGMANVAASLVTDRPSGINPTLPPCGTNGTPCVYARFGSVTPGNRALFAVVGSVDAAADRFPAARLVNAANKAVGPTAPAMRAALSVMKTNRDGVTQTSNYKSRNPRQYPITTVDYAMVPTCGLTAKKATAIQEFLHRAASAQHVGLFPGQLAPGDLPLSKRQMAQTKHAATLVSTKSCPKGMGGTGPGGRGPGGNGPGGTGPGGVGPGGVGPGGVGPGGVGPGGVGPGGVGPGGVGPGGVGPGGGSSGPGSNSSSGSPSSPGASPAPSSSPASLGFPHSDSIIPTWLVLPLALLLGVLLFVGGPVGYTLHKNGTLARVRSRLPRVRSLLRGGLHR